MLYRVPAELDFLLPSYPVDEAPNSRPWRGALLWAGLDNNPAAGEHTLARVHAVETEGDSRFDLWPENLSLRMSRAGFSLSDVHAWVKRIAPPLCMFMPASDRDSKVSKVNETEFRCFAKALRDRQMVAISRWRGPRQVPGSGLILFPVEASHGLLAAAIFHSSAIPDFTPTSSSPLVLGIREPTASQPPLHALQTRRSFLETSDFCTPSATPSPGMFPVTPSSYHTPTSPWRGDDNSNRESSLSYYTTPRTHYLHESNSATRLNPAVPRYGWPTEGTPSNYVLLDALEQQSQTQQRFITGTPDAGQYGYQL